MDRMNESRILLLGIILTVIVFTIGIAIAQDNEPSGDRSGDIVEYIKPYDGLIGPGSALYGLKISIENLGESFTFDDRQKLKIQLEHARNRIAEAEAELKNRNDDAANRAMEHFVEKIQAVDDRITGKDRNYTGLLEAQKEIVKHNFILSHLLDDHPNSTGLMRAFNNSLKLEDNFEEKTDISILPVVSRERVILKEARRDELRDIQREVLQVEAKIVGNDTEVKLRVKFISTSMDSSATAQEILNKLQLNKTEIDNVLEIQVVDFEELTETLEARADAGRNLSEVEAEFRFPLLKTTNRSDLVNGIEQKLSLLTRDRIIGALELRVKERREIREIDENEDIEVRAKIIGNKTKARIKVEFVTNETELGAISQEILAKLNLGKTAIDNLLEIEVGGREELKENQEARISIGKIRDIRREDRIDLEVERGDDGGRGAETNDSRREDRRDDRSDRHSEIGVGNNFSDVEFELGFVLNTVNRIEIVDGIFQKLSTLTVQDVLSSLEKARLEEGQRLEGRGEIRHEQEDERGGPGEVERKGNSSGRDGGGSSGGGRNG